MDHKFAPEGVPPLCVLYRYVRPKVYGFSAVLVIDRVLILPILVINRVWILVSSTGERKDEK